MSERDPFETDGTKECAIDGHRVTVMPLTAREGLVLKTRAIKAVGGGFESLANMSEESILSLADMLMAKVSVDDKPMGGRSYDLYFTGKDVLFFQVLKFAAESYFGDLGKWIAGSLKDAKGGWLGAVKTSVTARVTQNMSNFSGPSTDSSLPT